MKHLLSVVAALAITGSCEAGTITKAKITHQLSIKETYAGGVSATTLKFSLVTSLEADISLPEASGFSPATVIQTSFPVGPPASFRLTDDPKYQVGATAVKVRSTTVFNHVTWKRTISMRWDGGKLKLSAKITASQKLSTTSPVQWENVEPSIINTVTPTDLFTSLLGDNDGTEFLNLGTTVPVTISVLNSTAPKTNGSIKFVSTQSIRGAKL